MEVSLRKRRLSKDLVAKSSRGFVGEQYSRRGKSKVRSSHDGGELRKSVRGVTTR